jgi:drug/metabolite transporter (DMT)-like permease
MLGTGFAYIWNFRTIMLAGPAIASTVTYITPVVAVIAGVVFIHESVHWYQLVGGAIVLLSAALVQERIRIKTRKRPSE